MHTDSTATDGPAKEILADTGCVCMSVCEYIVTVAVCALVLYVRHSGSKDSREGVIEKVNYLP